MKKIKTFEDFMDDDQLLSPEEGEEKTSENITTDEFEMMCNDAFMENNIHIIKNILTNLKQKYITVDRKDLKNIYMEAVRRWHIKATKSLNM